MQDKYINATKLIERLKCEKKKRSRGSGYQSGR